MSQKKRPIVVTDLKDPQLKEDVQDKAERQDLTVSQVIRRLLRLWLREPNGPPGEGGG